MSDENAVRDSVVAPEKAQQTKKALEQDRSSFFDQFTSDFVSANGALQVTGSWRSPCASSQRRMRR